METRNPVIARMEKEAKANGGYAGFGTAVATQTAPAGYDVPPAMPVEMTPAAAPMTVNDVVVRTATLFVATADHRLLRLDAAGRYRHPPDRHVGRPRARILGRVVEEGASCRLPRLRHC